MNEICKNAGCTTGLTGRQKTFCSNKCRMASTRANKTPEDSLGSSNSNEIVHATLEHYRANSDLYIERTDPDKLNWGKYMTYHQLQEAGLKANRVSIPGDWDFIDKAANPCRVHEFKEEVSFDKERLKI